MSTILRKGRRFIVENSKWKVYLDHLRDGRGNQVPDYMVIEPVAECRDRITGVAVLPVINGRFLLIRCYRYAIDTEKWELPRGFVDSGEAPVDAAQRELLEETGLSCAKCDFVALGTYAPEGSTLAARGALFAAMKCSGTVCAPADELGLGQIRLFDQTEMEKLVDTSAIEDAGSLIAYYRLYTRNKQIQTLP